MKGDAAPFLDLSVRQFLAAVGSSEPTPGGGAVAAVAASSAAALIAMVARITEARKDARASAPQAARLRQSADELCRSLQEAALEDADSFEQYMAALRMPRDSDEQRASRRDARRAAQRRATAAPLGVARDARRLLDMAAELVPLANAHVVSDVAAAAQLTRAAVAAALVTVRVNLPAKPSASDEQFYEDVRDEAAELAANIDGIARTIQAAVENAIDT